MAKRASDYLEKELARPIGDHADFACLDQLDLTPEQRAKLTHDDVFWMKLVHKALHGDMKAMQEILDRRYGKASQHIINENHNHTYVNFLEDCVKKDALELGTPVLDAEIVEEEEKVPRVSGEISSNDGVSAEDTHADSGLFDPLDT